MTHGWPGTFFEMLPAIEALADPARHGGDPADAFDVIVPSIPGYGFSEIPEVPGYNERRTAELWAELMQRLGYDRYGVYGSDWGVLITRRLAATHPERIVGMHLPGAPATERRAPETDAERAYLDSMKTWQLEETGYQRIQGTKPQTLAYGLTDSPAGLAGWLLEKWNSWGDTNGDIESRFTKDQLATHISIYWFTGTILSSTRYYREHFNLLSGQGGPKIGKIDVPCGVAQFKGIRGMARMPRSLVAKDCDLRRWTEFDTGGHFPALEVPELLVPELRAFFRPLR